MNTPLEALKRKLSGFSPVVRYVRKASQRWPPRPEEFWKHGRRMLVVLVAICIGFLLKVQRRRITQSGWLEEERNSRRAKLMASIERGEDSAEEVIDMIDDLGKVSHEDPAISPAISSACDLIDKETNSLLAKIAGLNVLPELDLNDQCNMSEALENLQRYATDITEYEAVLQKHCSWIDFYIIRRQTYLTSYNEALSLLRNQFWERWRRVGMLVTRMRRQLIFVAISSGLSILFGALNASRYHYQAMVINMGTNLALGESNLNVTPTVKAMLLNEVVCLFVDIIRYQVSSFGKKEAIRELKVDIFTKLISQDIEWLERQDRYRLRSLVGSCGNTITSLLDYPVRAVENITKAAWSLFLLSKWNSRLGLILLLLLPLQVGVTEALHSFQEYLEHHYFFVPNLRGSINTMWQALVDLHAFQTLRTFGREPKEIDRFKQYTDLTGELTERGRILYRLFDPLEALMDNGVEIFTLWYGGQLALRKKMDFGDLSSFLIVAKNTFNNVHKLQRSVLLLSDEVLEKVERLMNLLNQKPRIGLGGTLPAPQKGEWHIEFQNVNFRYPSRPQALVLDEVSFEIRAGQCVGLVGHTGAGKSTITALCVRLYDPDSGRILLNGQDLRLYNVTDVRRGLGVVSQDLALLERTIRENVVYGLSDGKQDEETIEKVLRLYEANEFFDENVFPNGIDTKVGEQGKSLSGGQRQRLALARAMMKDPKCIILDEATSALDELSMRKIIEQVESSRKLGMTTIIIAHRLSNLRYVDKLVVMEKGRVVEEGTRRELLQIPDGHYRALVDSATLEDEHEL